MRLTGRTAAFGIGSAALATLVVFGFHSVATTFGDNPDDDIDHTANAFLKAWSAGQLDKAAALTTNPQAAATALDAYRDQTHVTAVDFDKSSLNGDTAVFSVTSRISYLDHHATWKYRSQLTVVHSSRTGKAVVNWQSAVIHPALNDGFTLETTETAATARITDRDGNELTQDAHPGLGPVLDQIKQRFSTASGQHGLRVKIKGIGDSGGGRVLADFADSPVGQLRTTLDTKVQRAAEQAVKQHPDASVVAVKPSTGEILAIANSTSGKFNPALEGLQAPGSSFEIVSAAALLDKGHVTPGQQTDCPAQATYRDRAFTRPAGPRTNVETFSDAFANSCDTAFVQLTDQLPGNELPQEARDVFGLGLDWQTGVATANGAVPEATGTDRAAALIGRGEVRLSILNLASVTATVKQGSFKQPFLLAPASSGRTPASASRSLPPEVARQLRGMMHLNATQGTGAQVMSSLSADTGSATGTADVGDGQSPNAWFTAYRDDLSVAALVQKGGEGTTTAGPIVRALLDSAG